MSSLRGTRPPPFFYEQHVMQNLNPVLVTCIGVTCVIVVIIVLDYLKNKD